MYICIGENGEFWDTYSILYRVSRNSKWRKLKENLSSSIARLCRIITTLSPLHNWNYRALSSIFLWKCSIDIFFSIKRLVISRAPCTFLTIVNECSNTRKEGHSHREKNSIPIFYPNRIFHFVSCRERATRYRCRFNRAHKSRMRGERWNRWLNATVGNNSNSRKL